MNRQIVYRQAVLGILLASLFLPACAGMIIGTATDVVIETAKVPFKVTGAVIDVVVGNDEDD